MTLAIFYLCNQNKFDLARLAYEKNPDVDFSQYSTEMLSHIIFNMLGNYVEPDLKLMKLFCENCKDALMTYINPAGESLISAAVRCARYDVINYFITTPKLYNQFIDVPSICIKLSLLHTLTLLENFNNKEPRPLKEKQYIADRVIRGLINRAQTKRELCHLIEVISIFKGIEFMKQYTSRLWYIRFPEWEGEKVTHLWMRLMEYAKQRMLRLAERENDFSDDDSCIKFLKTPTHSAYRFFHISSGFVTRYENIKKEKRM
ncbi:MAG: hypothetical protein P4M12_07400 [Gammaproteobacteria bacterium]|nr:hypothetical protein [Gammaproteobacteria bacterium]